MEEVLDKELENKEGLSVAARPPLPFEKPEKFIYIPSDVVTNVSQYLPIVISQKTGRDIDVKVIIENAQCMFRDGARYHDNLWMHHCAASMREIIIFLEPEDFHNALSSIPSPTDQNVEIVFAFFMHAKTYLSDVVHFRESTKIGNAEILYPNQGYGQKDRKDFTQGESDFFEKVCIDIVYTLHDLFSRFCKGQ